MRISSRLRAHNGLRYAGSLALLVSLYVLTAKLGLRLDAVSGFATLVWPPTGIALAALLLFGRKLWPAIALGAFVVAITNAAPLPVAYGMAVGNTLEAVVGATLLMRMCAFDRSIGRVRDVFALAFAAAVASTLISASIGVASLWAGGIVPASDVVATWRAWWVGDALGDLVIAPFALAWWYERAQPTRRGQRAEVAMLAVFATISALYAFGLIPPRPESEAFRARYLVFPVLAWASLRYRQRGATTATLIVWIVSLIASVQSLEPAARLSEGLLPLQLFMAVVALTTLFLGAAVRERDHAGQLRDDALARAETAERRARYVADASRILASGLDCEPTLQNVARLIVPVLADHCVVDIAQRDGTIRRVAEQAADPAKQELLRRLREFPPGSEQPGSPVLRVLATGRTEYVPEVDVMAVAESNDDYRAIVRAIAPRSSVTVPLKHRDCVLGAITFGMAESGRTYASADIELAEELASRAAIAVDNANLYDEAQQAIRARDVFLAVASHELRTPLTSLELQATNLRELLELSSVPPETILAKLHLIERQGHRLAALVEDLLDVSRVMAGHFRLVSEPLDVREIVRELAARFRDQAANAGCELIVEIEEASPACGDRLRIEQILTNLLSNAIKFGPSKPIRISLTMTAATITFAVCDQGCGIAPADHARVFERFEQASAQRSATGLGLGLWIVRQIVTAMGGTIAIASELGQGTEIAVTIPRALAEALEPACRASTAELSS